MSLRLVLGGLVLLGGMAAGAGCTVADPGDDGTGTPNPPGGGGSPGGGGVASQPGAGANGLPGAGNSSLPGAGNGSIPLGGSGGGGVPGGAGSGAGGMAGSGTAGGGPGGPYEVPRGMSAGCGKTNVDDEPGKYISHDIEVTGVDPYWTTKRKPYAGQAPYTFTHRAFSIRLPTGYDANKPYPIVFQGGGCGNTDGTSGKNGATKMIPDASGGEGIAIGMSYVYPDGAGACFQDEDAIDPDTKMQVLSYEIPYWEAIYKQVTENYCVNLEKVFVGGYSSGAWMAYTTAFAEAGKIRGMGSGAGGMREHRPMTNQKPFASMMITGVDDSTNPIHKTKDGTTCSGTEETGCWNGKIICGFPGADTCVDTGSAAARNEILERNGCVGTATQQYSKWPECKQYTGCPAAFPVVYCAVPGGHTDGGERLNPGVWEFWKALPAVP